MKQGILGSVGVLFIALFLVLSQSNVRAVQVATDEQVAAVKSRCAELTTLLRRQEANDKLLRHNIGSTFLVISEKLMIPLNQRIASNFSVNNQLDGSDLVAITASYTKAYKGSPEGDFYGAYAKYENSLLSVIQTDCTKQPERFLERLDTARKERIELHGAAKRLEKLAAEYKVAFDAFRAQYQQQEDGIE